MRPKWKWFLGLMALFIVLALWVSTAVLVPLWYPAIDKDAVEAGRAIQNPGIFGDMFGAVNALFAGLSFAGVVFALLYQTGELRAQQEEQKLLRQSLVQLAELQSEQSDTLRVLAFVLRQGSRKEGLAFMIQDTEKRMERLDAALPRMFTKGSPTDAQREQMLAEIKRLKKRVEALRKELTEMADEDPKT